MERRELGCQPAVDLFRIGRVRVPSAEPGLDVDGRDAVVEGGEGPDERRGRVALHDDGIGPLLGDHRRQTFEGADRHVGERLAILDDVEIARRHDAERGEDLIEHLTMLCGHGHNRFERVRPFKGQNDGS